MTEKTVILLKESFADSCKRDVVLVLTVCVPIGLGVFLQSSAMQWAGFILAAFYSIGRVGRIIKDNSLTIAQARAKLDEIERGGP